MNLPSLCRRMIFTQVLLGVMAACMAEKNPGLLLIAGAVAAMSWYVTEGPGGRFLPRWLVNLGALVASGWLALELLGQRTHVVSAMAHFIMALQLLLLYARKSDREYSQLLVLSLLQMISASVISVSMIYGVFLAVYCGVALITLLLFHLATTADQVHEANLRACRNPAPGFGPSGTTSASPPQPPLAAAVPRPDRVITRLTRRQLRRTTVVLGLICGVVATAVFVVLPRTGRSGIDFGPTAASAPAQTGFSTTVRLGIGPMGTGSREPMLNLTIRSNDQPIGQEDEHWLVRGAALDHYNPVNHTWHRSGYATQADQPVSLNQLNAVNRLTQPYRSSLYTAEIALRDSRHRTLFSVVAPPGHYPTAAFDLVRFTAPNLRDILYSPLDQQLQTTESEISATTYQVSWPIMPRPPLHPGLPPGPADADAALPSDRAAGGVDWSSPAAAVDSLSTRARRWLSPAAATRSGLPEAVSALPPALDSPSPRRSRDPLFYNYQDITAENYARHWQVQLPRVRKLAQRILTEAGYDRDVEARHSPDDLRIATAFAEHLRKQYQYDLANPRSDGDRDPLIDFLFERRRGHCELFAAGLAALCRSVGIPARLITGFRASEYNALGGYYVVRQSNAHAWTEVYAGPDRGWATLDATPSDEVSAEHQAPAGLFASIRQIYEHIEFAWIRTVVAFDSRTQQAIVDQVNFSIDTAFDSVEHAVGAAADRAIRLPEMLHLSRLAFVSLLLSGGGLALAGFILIRLHLARRRRLARLQLTRLPAEQRRALSKNLNFYLHLLDLLERHGHRRPLWQSPHQFALELSRRFPLRFDPVVALTEIFYDVRFGHRIPDAATRQRIRIHLRQLEQTIHDPSYSPDLPADFHTAA